MKNIFARIAVLAVVAILFAFAPSAHAQGIKNAGAPLKTVSGLAGVQDKGDVESIVGTSIGAILSLVGILFFALMVYAGILWMTARGEEEQITKARKIIIASLIGLAIAVSAWAITVFVTGKLTG